MKRRRRFAKGTATAKGRRKVRARSTPKAKQLTERERVPDFIPLWNTHDKLAIETLRSASVGQLSVDLLVGNDPQTVRRLREAMLAVYRNAAQTRELRKATKHQISKARSALTALTTAIECLESVSTDGSCGLRMMLEGPLLGDERGERDVNRFAGACWKIRLDIAPSATELQSVIAAETEKSTTSGERPKRLRTLVEALSLWWLSGGGKSIAPYVKANRRDDGPAVVHGRSGKFLALAVALLCEVDVFKQSEVEATVTNVHEAQLQQKGRNRSSRGVNVSPVCPR